MRLIGDTSDFNPAEILESLRRGAVYQPQTTIEAKEILADWWEALALELHICRRETARGQVNHRVTQDDTDHAGQMAAWLRWAGQDEAWSMDRENSRALTTWQARRPQGADKDEIARAFATLPEQDRNRLSTRPRKPDQGDRPIPRPRDYLPIDWPKVPPKLVPWSVYMGWLLAEKRARAGIVEREPGEDREEDDDAAE